MRERGRRILAVMMTVALTSGLFATGAYAEETKRVAEPQQMVEMQAQTSRVPASIFDDITESDWHHSYVGYVLNKGIMTGKGNNLFAPAEEIVRAQFAVVLYRMSGSPSVAYSATFPDIPDGQFYSQAVSWASQETVGIITGYDNGRFGPQDAITREEMATMLWRYAKYCGLIEEEAAEASAEEPDLLESFPDADKVNEFAKEAMRWAVREEVISGDSGLLNPQGRSNRAVCATMITRFCEKFIPQQLPDIEMTASCGAVSADADARNTGDFWIHVADPRASMEIEKIQATAYVSDDQSDAFLYDLTRQENGVYSASANVGYHGWKFGTYKIQAWALLSNGIRLPIANTTVQVNGTPARARVYMSVSDVYRQVGYDLNACYWWVVRNVTYKKLPIHLTPPDGYSRAEWYAIQAFENRAGNCFCYAAAFYFLAQGLGYDVEYIEGQVGMARGGYGPHGWVVIRLNGASYICDPEAQREIGKYNFYMQPISSPVLRYKW